MLRLAARYLVEEKRTDGLPLDAVARFHLGNGARVEALRWEADGSERGMAQSYGTMVNYLYDLGAIEDNHEAFRQSDRVPASAAVTALLKDDRQEKAIKWPIRSTTP